MGLEEHGSYERITINAQLSKSVSKKLVFMLRQSLS